MAAFPTAASHPQMSGVYLPRLYAKRLLIEFYSVTVFAAIANTDYEGQIKSQGDTVRIRQQPDVTIRDYTKGAGLNYERPDPGSVDLEINKGKYWAFNINKVDEVQSDLAYATLWASHAAEKLKIAIDTDVLANVYADAHASNKGATAGAISGDINLGVTGTPLQITKTNVLEKIVDCGTVLSEQDVPEDGRWMVIPNWAAGLIKQSDLKDASLAGDGTSIMRNGRIGVIDSFTLFRSNLLATTTDGSDTVVNSIFGTSHSLTFASQMTESETLKDPNDFGNLLRGLQVYGYKTVKSEAMGHFYIKK
tara:strand:- start:2913 stop:3833 length:921 start_codon:yes stop_codon:yes gene_type:complete